jgi:hypothetical protein
MLCLRALPVVPWCAQRCGNGLICNIDRDSILMVCVSKELIFALQTIMTMMIMMKMTRAIRTTMRKALEDGQVNLHRRFAGGHFAREGKGTHTERFLEAYLGLKAFRSCCFSSSVACKVSTNVPAEPKNRSPSKPSSRLSSSSRDVVWIAFIAHLFSGPSIVLPAIDVIASLFHPPAHGIC